MLLSESCVIYLNRLCEFELLQQIFINVTDNELDNTFKRSYVRNMLTLRTYRFLIFDFFKT